MPTARLDDTELAYEVEGDGPPLLLIAGTAYAGGTWWPQSIDVLAQTFTVITYDHRGTGATPGTPGLYSTRMLAEDAAGLLEHLGLEQVHVAGHSMGGRVAQWLALDRPDLVETLVLLASGPGAFPGQFEDGEWMIRGLPLKAAASMVEHGYEAFFEGYIRHSMLTAPFQRQQAEEADAIVQHITAYRPTLQEYLKHSIARQEHQTTELLDRLKMPLLVVIGEEDRDVGGTGSHWQQSMYLYERISHSDLLTIPDGAHGFLWEHPKTSTEQIAGWLTSVKR